MSEIYLYIFILFIRGSTLAALLQTKAVVYIIIFKEFLNVKRMDRMLYFYSFTLSIICALIELQPLAVVSLCYGCSQITHAHLATPFLSPKICIKELRLVSC
uniref:Uncharacterized protein n=1 Tax=Amphimedon queenslandica TaxID=400682 RepID=A0A1X7VML0_AMPQE